MREHPILFSAPMVRAILEGRKTQTRRVVKGEGIFVSSGAIDGHGVMSIHDGDIREIRCPYGVPGDRLWVRETMSCTYVHGTWYTADGMEAGVINDRRADKLAARYGSSYFENEEKRIPSIYMPRWASRITLEITGVRVERLQDISESDAVAEGVTDYHNITDPRTGEIDRDAVDAYEILWKSINGADSWAANPWVWVLEFKRIKP